MTALVQSQQRGTVLRLTLNDETSRNSLSEQMMAELLASLRQAQNQNISVVIVGAVGPAFSSGHNLKELEARRQDADHGQAYFESIFATCSALMLAIASHRCVTIAEIDGLASAAGCQLVASCDLAYASSRATFCTPGVNIGLFCSTPMVALSRSVHRKHAMEMLLTGDVFDSCHAKSIGLINDVIEQNQLNQHVSALAEKISSKSQSAIAFGKRAFDDQINLSLADAYISTSKIMAENLLHPCAAEGIAAVLHKRHPQWP